MFRRSASSLLFASSAAQRMRVIVGVKQVVDYTVKVRVKDNKVQTANVKMSINPFCEIAIEEAAKLKEKKIVTEVIAVTIGKKSAEPVLRTALAVGADKAVHIVVPDADADTIEPLAIAKIFAKLHAELKPDLWLLGKQAVDSDYGATPQMLASLIDAPQGTFASALEVSAGKVKVTREIDSGRQVVELTTPCVVTADLRLNTPRNVPLPKIMAARKVKIDTREVAALGVDVKPHLTQVAAAEPESRKAGVKVKTVEELYSKLVNEAKVL